MVPFSGSISPVRIFMKVDLPAPLGPVIAYRRPGRNVAVTSSNKMRAPKRIVTSLTDIKVKDTYLGFADRTNSGNGTALKFYYTAPVTNYLLPSLGAAGGAVNCRFTDSR